MNLDAIFRAANENTDPDPSERDFAELMANALRVCLDDLLAKVGRNDRFAALTLHGGHAVDDHRLVGGAAHALKDQGDVLRQAV